MYFMKYVIAGTPHIQNIVPCSACIIIASPEQACEDRDQRPYFWSFPWNAMTNKRELG